MLPAGDFLKILLVFLICPNYVLLFFWDLLKVTLLFTL